MAATARERQRRRQLILLLAGLVLLLGGGFYLLLSGPEEAPATAVERPPGRVAMPVVKAPIRKGELITPAKIDIVYRRPEQIPPDAVIHMKAFLDRRARRNLAPGEYIHYGDLTEEQAPPGYSGLVPRGKRAIVIPTAQITGATSYLTVGDRLDVLVSVEGAVTGGGTSAYGANNPGAAARARSSPRALPIGSGGTMALLAEGAEVLEVPVKGIPRPGTPDRENVVLAVAPEEAYRIHIALLANQPVRFLFRPFNEEEMATPEMLQSERVLPRIIRGSSPAQGKAKKPGAGGFSGPGPGA